MPANARPIGSSTGIVRDDLDGFGLVTLWYVPDGNGCNMGRTFITVHDVPVTGAASQIHGEQIANEPVVGAVFVAGKLLVIRQDGPRQVIVPGMGTIREGVPERRWRGHRAGRPLPPRRLDGTALRRPAPPAPRPAAQGQQAGGRDGDQASARRWPHR